MSCVDLKRKCFWGKFKHKMLHSEIFLGISHQICDGNQNRSIPAGCTLLGKKIRDPRVE